MSIYLVERMDYITWDDTIEMVIEAKNEEAARDLFGKWVRISGAPYDEEGRNARRAKVVADAKVTRLGATDRNFGGKHTVIVHSQRSG